MKFIDVFRGLLAGDKFYAEPYEGVTITLMKVVRSGEGKYFHHAFPNAFGVKVRVDGLVESQYDYSDDIPVNLIRDDFWNKLDEDEVME